MTQQIYEQIRESILHNELQPGERIPSTRELANNIGVSRNIVLEAYDQLIAEGFIYSQPRLGTFVADGSSLRLGRSWTPASMIETCPNQDDTSYIDFRAANPAIDYFPRKVWGQLAKQVCNQASDIIFSYSHPLGLTELRQTLSKYLHRYRGVKCHPDQILITSGATQAFHLISQCFKEQNAEIIMEDPITYEIRNLFISAGYSIYPIPVDQKGMQTHLLPPTTSCKLIFVMPSHQFPMGGVLPIQRRTQLIQYARDTHSFIIEDDYDSEFTYEGSPVPSLQGLDPERVIYIGTFSKILSPGLRIGYAVLPPILTHHFQRQKWLMDRHTSSLEQRILARFLEEGHMERHIRKMKKIYRKRRQTLISSLKQEFPYISILGQATGIHLVADFANVVFTSLLTKQILQEGVKIYPVEDFALQKGGHLKQIVMGYGSLSPEIIKEGVYRLKRAIQSVS
jgi:GntR family transcriptional regulator/MocR family aminotransferase